MDDSLEHLSKKTRERAFILARNAKSIGLPMGKVRFTPQFDYMSYHLTDGESYIIIFCTPNGYLSEVYMDDDRQISCTYLGIKNIRHYLQYAKKQGYKDIDDMMNENEDEQDLRGYVEDLDDESE